MENRYLKQKYFNWLCNKINYKAKTSNDKYNKLLRYLFNKSFTYTIELDENRYADGLELRSRFFDYVEYTSAEDDTLSGPCSILEMLIALALRCEEHIMCDENFGDRTGHWFWKMIFNLNLRSMTDDNFDKTYVDSVIYKFLNREYEPDGTGGLFKIKHCKYDLRQIEIWYQLCWYLSTL